ncbi:MAG: MATE family efflux transporter [Lachnospiraceae bacterium]|nr:MATE family efflux transporter [Lachnospiraceae bacterium]
MMRTKVQISDHFTYRRLLRFVLPPAVMMLFTSIYTVVDGFFVSNFVGSTALAGVNLIYPIIWILGSFGFMVGSGGNALVGKYLGEGKDEEARRIFSFLMLMLVIIGTLLAVGGFIFIRPLGQLIGADGELLDLCVIYGRISFIGLPFLMMQVAFGNFLITAEKGGTGLVVTICAGATNIIMDALLVAVLKLGIGGAALATILSQICASVICLVTFFRRGKKRLYFVRPVKRWRAFCKSLYNGASEFLTNVSSSIVCVIFNVRLMAMAGENGVAAYGVIMYVCYVFLAIFFGYAMSCTSLISYNYGADNRPELKNLFKKSLVLMPVTGVIMVILAELMAVPLSEIYVGYDPALLEMTVRGFRLFSFSYALSGVNCFASAFFTGFNNGTVSGVLSVLRSLVFQIIAVFVLPLLWGLDGIWLAVTAAEAMALCASILCFVLFRKRYHYA